MKYWTNFSKKQTRELLKEPGWTLDYELSNRVSDYGTEVYHNIDGRIFINTGIDGSLFKSRADFIKHIEDLKSAIKTDKAASSLSHRIPQGRNFVSEVPQLIDELAKQLHIPREELDNSENSLDTIDRAVKRIGRNKCLQPEIFPSLVAYVGEVIKQATDGRWALRFEEDGEVWEPWIIDSRGEAHPPFILILKQLEEERDFSIHGVTFWEIQAYRMDRKQGWEYGRELGWEYDRTILA